MSHVDKQHPRDTEHGAIAWTRPKVYVVGDRVRETVLLITPDLIIEMQPWFAESVAGELSHHASDVRQGVPSPPDTSTPEHP